MQSCVTYQKSSVSIEQSINHRKAKVIDNNGINRYDNIEFQEGGYYGLKTKGTHEGYITKTREELDSSNISAVFLEKIIIHRVWIKSLSEPRSIRGILYDVKDSSILVSSSTNINKYKSENIKTIRIPVYSIERIKIRRINNIGRGAGYGIAVGFSIGMTIGLVADDDIGYSALAGAAFAIPGAFFGMLFNSKKDVYDINGELSAFTKHKRKLELCSIHY